MKNKRTLVLWTDPKSQPSLIVAGQMHRAKRKFIVRNTGGCAYDNRAEGEKSVETLVETLTGFEGTVIHGGTRVWTPADNELGYEVHPSILEAPSILRLVNQNMVTIGVVPRLMTVEIDPVLGHIISKSPNGNLTTIHPDQDMYVVLQRNIDQGFTANENGFQPKSWTAEWHFCFDAITALLQNANASGACLIAYNGGKYTQEEVLYWIENKLPVIIFTESGRFCSEFAAQFASNHVWRAAHPHVFFCKKSSEARNSIQSIGGF